MRLPLAEWGQSKGQQERARDLSARLEWATSHSAVGGNRGNGTGSLAPTSNNKI